MGGKHPAPYTIVFDLQSPPAGEYHLRISALLVNPSVPDLMVEINGHGGRYFFNRKISYYPGDDRIDSPIYGGDTLDISLPAKFFKAGENKLVLTAVEDADNPDTRASLIYDALKLTQCPSRRVQPSAAVKPSVFFRQKENQTYEVTRVTITVAGKLGPGSVDLSIGGMHFRAALAGANDFGQERIDFDVPEFSGQVTANVAIHASRKTYRSSAKVSPERKWFVYFVPHAHLDIGYPD